MTDSILMSVVNFILVLPVLGLIGLAVAPIEGDPGASEALAAAAVGATFIIIIVMMIAVWLYFALMESSGKGATLGKRALGIKVTGLNGNRISFGKATGRFFGKMIFGVILYIGFIMAGFTEKKQALQDIVAGCLVVNK